MASHRLLVALCAVALLAVRSESHVGLQDIPLQGTGPNQEMQSFFGVDKPEAVKPEALDAATMAAKPEAASAIPTTTTAGATATGASAPPRRSVSVAAGVACGVAAVAVVGVAAAVAYVVRARRGARRESAAPVQLGAAGTP
ncbi:hypothetical protein ACP4OV_026499 [Aristida adscensionis]